MFVGLWLDFHQISSTANITSRGSDIISLVSSTLPPNQIIYLIKRIQGKIVKSSSSSSIGTTADCGLWSVEQCPSVFSYLPPTLSIFLFPALEDLFLLPLSIFSWVFPFFSTLPFLEWISFWASYPPPFSLGDLTSLSFDLLSILLYFLFFAHLF